ncbi:MAG TPA: helix-hairpin-helix domain-containing protein [Bryobacteraceae bacterium]|nr:helix-hairpin-helix domain-containing protein [Bryobacteraceae bacterium]
MKPVALLIPVLALAHAQDLPAGKGKELVEQACGACHGLEVIPPQRATRKGWSSIVDNMIERGATATPDEVNAIVEYLAKNFGKVNVNKATAKEIEVGLGLTGKEAEAILKYRQEHGEFKGWDSLVKVAEVDSKKLEGKREWIAFQ